jgi:O-antigen/teichoic acid export membrane protein
MKLKRINKIDIDKAIIYSLLSKGWSFIAGPITALLISNKFTPNIQGYYYTFATLLSLQVFIELGLGTVTQQFVSHEWANLKIDENNNIAGDEDSLSRLYSISKISFKWFFYGAIILSFSLAIGGYLYFHSTTNYNINWQHPWLALSLFSFGTIQLVPFWSILEGCNQLKELYAFRMIQAFVINITTWICIYFDFNLWVPAVISLISFLCAIIFIKIKYWKFFKQIIFSKSIGPVIDWKKDMFPMHWQIAVSWISGFLSFSLFTPILFKYQGPEIAGKFGLTWTIINTIGGVASAWLNTKIPTLSMLVAKKNFLELNNLFKSILKNVVLICLLGSLSFLFFVLLTPLFHIAILTKFVSRLLPPLPLGIFLVAQLVQISTTPFSAYLRSHKQEPGMKLSVISAILISISTYIFGRYFSITYLALSYFLIITSLFPLLIKIWKDYSKSSKETILT